MLLTTAAATGNVVLPRPIPHGFAELHQADPRTHNQHRHREADHREAGTPRIRLGLEFLGDLSLGVSHRGHDQILEEALRGLLAWRALGMGIVGRIHRVDSER